MRPLEATGLILLTLMFLPGHVSASTELQIQLGDPSEIGREGLLFGSVAAVCEDSEGHFYVVDQLEHKVYKFSSQTELLLSFGRQGQGPGDFQRPNRISLTSSGDLAVADEMFTVSFIKTDGTFLKRIMLNNALVPGYIGDHRFYAWRWSPEGQQQILLDADGNILTTFHTAPRDRFSISIPDRSGRKVMFNYGRSAFAPTLLYAQQGEFTALAMSDRYHIQLLDREGNPVRTLRRNLQPESLSRDERKFFEEEFQELGRMRGWPQRVVREIGRRLPKTKSYFDRILLSPTHVFVCRISPDITHPDVPQVVDIFHIDGTFIGTASLPEKPLFISARRMYFVRSDTEGNFYLVVREYRLT
jgi:hypothetical protein